MMDGNYPAKPDSSPDPDADRKLPVHWTCPGRGCDICQGDWPCARLAAEQSSQQRDEDAEPVNESKSRMASPRCVASDLLEESKRLPPYDSRRELLSCAAWLLENYALALETAANSQPTSNDRQIRSSAPAGGLVERITERIVDAMVISDQEAGCAGILACADWLSRQGVGAGTTAARWLREEVKRGQD